MQQAQKPIKKGQQRRDLQFLARRQGFFYLLEYHVDGAQGSNNVWPHEPVDEASRGIGFTHADRFVQK